MRLPVAVIVMTLVAVAGASAGRQLTPPPPSSDLDRFMARVLAQRDENWKKLRQYVLDERETASLIGPSGEPLWGEQRDYTWFIRDGIFVRSPVRANGVTVSDTERRRYEDAFARRARTREESGGADTTAGGPADVPSSAEAMLTGARQPRFIDTAYFLRFKFEPGRYALVGPEVIDGVSTLRIEYYPERLFSHEQDDQNRRRRERRDDRDEDVEAATEQMMNKVSLVTLWVEPNAHQIVRYTFDNVEMDFLPAAWLLRVTDARASMSMGQPFPDVWLPREVDMEVGAMFAAGSVHARYRLEYHDYREATTSGTFRLPDER